MSGSTFTFPYDPMSLHEDFPNLDLTAHDEHRPGLADQVTIGLLLCTDEGACRANVISLRGEEVRLRGPAEMPAPREAGGRVGEPAVPVLDTDAFATRP